MSFVKPPFGDPGGKACANKPKLALRHITGRLGNLDGQEYCEPMLGGGAVLLNYAPPSARVWLNDLDTGIACLWAAVIRSPDLLATLIEIHRPFPLRELFEDCRQRLLRCEQCRDGKRSDVVYHGFAKYVVWACNRNSLSELVKNYKLLTLMPDGHCAGMPISQYVRDYRRAADAYRYNNSDLLAKSLTARIPADVHSSLLGSKPR